MLGALPASAGAPFLPPPLRGRSAAAGCREGGIAGTTTLVGPPPPALPHKGGGSRRRSVFVSTQFHQRRQEAGQCLARAGRRDQQRRAIVARLLEQRQLMRARRPAAHGEPAQEVIGQQVGSGDGFTRRHASELGIHRRHCEARKAGFPGLAMTARSETLLRHRLVGDDPILAVEPLGIQRRHRNIGVIGIAVAHPWQHLRSTEAVQADGLFQHVLMS